MFDTILLTFVLYHELFKAFSERLGNICFTVRGEYPMQSFQSELAGVPFAVELVENLLLSQVQQLCLFYLFVLFVGFRYFGGSNELIKIVYFQYGSHFCRLKLSKF